MESPYIIKGAVFKDCRGSLKYNNDFDLLAVKRTYIIQNATVEFERGWQGHKIEKRWFSSLEGAFKIKVLKLSDWEIPRAEAEIEEFLIQSETLDILYVPDGYITKIKSEISSAKLLVFSDYHLNEVNDNYKFDCNLFE